MKIGIRTVAVSAAAVFLATAIAAGAFVYEMGAVHISVKAKKPGGDNIRLILPGAGAPMGVWLAPDDKLRKALKEAGPHLPAIRAAADELAVCPDSTLIEVVEKDERVHVAKQGSHLVIDVDNVSESVHVSVPFATVRLVAAQLAAIQPEPAEAASESAPL